MREYFVRKGVLGNHEVVTAQNPLEAVRTLYPQATETIEAESDITVFYSDENEQTHFHFYKEH